MAAKDNKDIALSLLECPVCLETMTVPIFQCQSGHSICNNCTTILVPPICPMCRQGMTQMRNWKLEEIVMQMKLPCPNKSAGCSYTMVKANIDDHVKECIFREMECPLGNVFGRCSWRGQLKEMAKHFKDRHPENCNVDNDADVVLSNIVVTEDDRHFFLVTQGKLHFIITFKLDTLQKMAYWMIQHIGNKCVAHQHIYEIHVTSNQDVRKKVVYTEHCTTDAVKVEDIIRQGKCAFMPLDYLTHFIKDKKLTFRFFIKRIPGPAKNETENGKNKPDNQGGPKGPGPKGPPPKSGKPKGPPPKGSKPAKA